MDSFAPSSILDIRKRFADVNEIITHPGEAHRDDFLSVSFFLAVCPWANVTRRSVENGDSALSDPTIAVIDVGMAHDCNKRNFDHHQRDRGMPALCSITLVLDAFQILPMFRESSGWWLEFTEVADSKGPRVASQLLGDPPLPRAMGLTSSPIETYLLKEFSKVKELNPWSTDGTSVLGSLSFRLMLQSLGAYYLNHTFDFHKRQALLAEKAEVKFVNHGEKSLAVLDASFLTPEENPSLGIETFCNNWTDRNWIPGEVNWYIAATVTQDDRSDGLCLFRRNDDARLDFSQLEGLPGVIFAHKSGFVAKLKKGTDWQLMIRMALTGAEGV